MRMKARTMLLAALVVLAAVATPATAALTEPSTDAETYSGTHIEYDVDGNVIANYTVDGETIFESVAVESASDYESRTDASGSVGLTTVVSVDGFGLDLAASSTTQATVETSGSTKIVTHDNEDGTLVVQSGEGDQFVEVGLGSDAQAEAAGDDRVVVETGNGTTGTFIVVGDGDVTVNEAGNVSAELGEDAQLVFRESGQERDEDEKQVEQMIANGTATAEVYVDQQDGETVKDTVTYGQNTTVEAKQSGESTVNMTVERTESDGKVVVTHIAESAVEATESFDVTVDGEAAASAESYSELQAAANDGDEPKYFVAQNATAEAEGSAAVLVAFDHFSERHASITGTESANGDDSTDGESANGDDSTDGETPDDGETTSSSNGMPGFGVTATLLALVGAAFVALRTRE